MNEITMLMYSDRARENHEECIDLYEAVRAVYKSQQAMDLDKSIIMDSFIQSFGTDFYEQSLRHRNVNIGLSKSQIAKRNKKRSLEEVNQAIADKAIHEKCMTLAKEHYLHLRKYAFYYHKISDDEKVQFFLDEFIDEFFLNMVN
jgi:hypothetical protein